MKKKERILELEDKVKALEKELLDKKRWKKISDLPKIQHEIDDDELLLNSFTNHAVSSGHNNQYLFCETTQEISNSPISVKLNKDIVFCNLGYLESSAVTRIKRYLKVRRLTIDELKYKLSIDSYFCYGLTSRIYHDNTEICLSLVDLDGGVPYSFDIV